MSQTESAIAFLAVASVFLAVPRLLNYLQPLPERPRNEKARTYIECPSTHDGSGLTLFLAGGISSCSDWQATIAARLGQACPQLFVYNPRRKDFDVNDPNATPFQIAWEHDHLRRSKAILFWFPPETLCPITLYELGTWTQLGQHTGTKIFIGCDSNYKRIDDVKIQTRMADPTIPPIVTSIDALADLVIAWYHNKADTK
jgi:hypothetical protein